ncbi:hypothetical protein D9M71_822120 [compost metagenome]
MTVATRSTLGSAGDAVNCCEELMFGDQTNSTGSNTATLISAAKWEKAALEPSRVERVAQKA